MCIARWVHKTHDNDSSSSSSSSNNNTNTNTNPNPNHPHTQNHTHNYNHHNWIVPTPTSLSLSLILRSRPGSFWSTQLCKIHAKMLLCQSTGSRSRPSGQATVVVGFGGVFFQRYFFLESRNHQIDTYKSIDSIICVSISITHWKIMHAAWRLGSDHFPDFNWVIFRFQPSMFRGVSFILS